MRRTVWTVCIFLLMLFPKPVLADDAGAVQAPVTSINPIVVTATRQKNTESSLPDDITIITAADIRQSTATNVPDLLRTLPGVDVRDITGNQRDFVVDLRGFGETAQSNTLVLVDGRRINEADLSGTDWTLIPLNRIARIEIIRGGGGSVLYGDNATGGVINIITKKGHKTTLSGGMRVGSDNLFETSAGASGTEKDLSYAVSGNYYSSDGYRDNSATIAKNLGANLAYYLGDAATINLGAGYHKDSTGLPGALTQSELDAGLRRTATLSPKDYADTEDTYVSVGPELYFPGNSLFRLDMSFRNRSMASYSTFTGGNFEGDSSIKTTAISPRAVIREPVMGLKNDLVAGFDFSDATEDITNSTVFFGSPSVGKFKLEKKNYGGYAHDKINITDRLSLSGGYRYDWVKYQFSPSSPESANMDENLFTTGINYRFGKQSNIYASFSRSFRYPVMDELFSFFTNTINTGLLPQTSDDIEAGLRHSFTDRFYGSIHVFRINTSHEIFFNLADYQNENLDGDTRRDGVELTLTRVFDRFRVSGNYTYENAEIRGGQFAGKTIPGVPSQKASLDTRIDLGWGFALGLNGTYVGQRYFESDFSNRFAKQSDYTVVNARLDYTRKHYTFFLIGNNLFNETYSEYGVLGGTPLQPSYYPSPKINFIAGVSFRY